MRKKNKFMEMKIEGKNPVLIILWFLNDDLLIFWLIVVQGIRDDGYIYRGRIK